MRPPAAALALLALAALVTLATGSAGADHASTSIGLLAIDARTEGNTATDLGRLDGCAESSVDGLITVDYVVDAVPGDRPLIGFEAEIRYNPRILEVVAVQTAFLLAAEGSFAPFAGLSDSLPDSDGVYRITVLDTASQTFPEANVESGPGVLARITFRGKVKGVSPLAVGFERKPDLLYPLVVDTQNEVIQVDHLGGAVVSVGRDCPRGWQKPRISQLPSVSKLVHPSR